MLGALLGQWKLIAAVAGVAGLFFAGWTVNGWRWESRIADAERQHAADVREAQARVRAEWDAQRLIDEANRDGLNSDLERLRNVNTRLNQELADAQLVKPETVIETQWRDRVVTEEVEVCGPPTLANPFSAQFVGLFNDSASRNAGGLPGADPSG